MYNFIREKWFSIDSKLKYDLKVYNDVEKKENERSTEAFIKQVDLYIKTKPLNKSNEEEWLLKGEKLFGSFFKEDKIFDLSYLAEDIQNKIMKITRDFIKKAKEFDKDIAKEDIFQALRNVWIITILQAMLNKDIDLTKSVFAYSMMYPYTDNLLDDVKIDIDEKGNFNDKLSRVLKGEKVEIKSDLEKKINELIKYIEDDYCRNDFKKVYSVLLMIHESQVESLKQQGNFSLPYETDILGISIKKGASSVLADGYLIKGNLNKEEENFCLQYGFLLQLVDDFQDLKSDKKNEHITIMSQLAGRYSLDGIINKLINYTCSFFDEAKILKEKSNFKRVIKVNCLVLILCSIAVNKEYFTEEYLKEISKHLPFGFEYIEKLDKKLNKRLKSWGN